MIMKGGVSFMNGIAHWTTSVDIHTNRITGSFPRPPRKPSCYILESCVVCYISESCIVKGLSI